MKTFISTVLLSCARTCAAQQGPIKTETIAVSGNCGDCKERIENAADIKGVKLAKWSDKTHVATITYDTTRTSLLAVKQAIAASGYDAGEVKGSERAYKRLPDCCKYRDKKCEEPEGK